jgi:predicted phage terminase large subunit-like protein
MPIGDNRGSVIAAAQRALAQNRLATRVQLANRQWSLAEFFQRAWNVLEPSTPLIWGWHLQAICDHVEALLTGDLGKRNLMILVPPGSSKSRIVSVMTTAWQWLRRPGWQGLYASGNPRVTTRDSIYCRALIESHWYQRSFGCAWQLQADQNTKQLFGNTAHGFRMAVTANTKITGDRADALFIDDPLDASDAYSKVARDGVLTWFDQAFSNRLNDLRRGIRCLIQQRLHSEDLAGHLIARESAQWEVLTIKQEFDEASRTVTSLGWTDPRTEDGELMQPERFPADIIAQEKLRLGASAYAGQHQQLPSAADGELFKRGCLQKLTADALPECLQVILSLDSAFSEKQTADYSVCIVMGQTERGMLLLDVIRGRYAYPQLQAIVTELAARWHPSAVLIEAKASGQSLIQSLQQETTLPVVPVNVTGDKVSRAHMVTPTFEAHRVYAPTSAAWLEDFEAELYAFPKAPHDDQVDAFTQALSYLTQNVDFTAWIAAVSAPLPSKNAHAQGFGKLPGATVTPLAAL